MNSLEISDDPRIISFSFLLEHNIYHFQSFNSPISFVKDVKHYHIKHILNNLNRFQKNK